MICTREYISFCEALLLCRLFICRYSRGAEHILYAHAVALCRVIYKHMGTSVNPTASEASGKYLLRSSRRFLFCTRFFAKLL